jgi:hypothetical protein
MSDLVKLYNPANAASLTQEQISGLQKLTSQQIKELALAYPNKVMNKAYLLIIDSNSKVQNQLPTLSTFENLYNIREKNGQRNYVATNFKGNYTQKSSVNFKAKKTQVVDLSDTELLVLPGFKVKPEPVEIKKVEEIAPIEVKVKKVKKEKIK